MSNTLPFRMKIAKSLCDGDAKDYGDLMGELAREFPNNGQLRRTHVETHLMALKAVGILREDQAYLDGDKQVVMKYRITDFGRARVERACQSSFPPVGRILRVIGCQLGGFVAEIRRSRYGSSIETYSTPVTESSG